MKIEERELSQGRGWIKRNILFLQLSYNTILHLGRYCSTIVKFFTIGRLNNRSFWSWYAKIYQHMAFESPNVNALSISIHTCKILKMLYFSIKSQKGNITWHAICKKIYNWATIVPYDNILFSYTKNLLYFCWHSNQWISGRYRLNLSKKNYFIYFNILFNNISYIIFFYFKIITY